MAIKIIHKCFLCGKENSEIGNICGGCKSESPFLHDDVCTSCGIALVSEIKICLRCRETEYSFESNRSLFEYKNTAKEIFYQYKFKEHKKIAFWYAELLSQRIKNNYKDYLVVPSPYKYWKKVKKGWDQVETITSILKNNYALSVKSLLGKKDTSDQKKLDLEERRINLKGKIIYKSKRKLEGRKILLIDDIFTTGATAEECSIVLKENGASVVRVLTVAID